MKSLFSILVFALFFILSTVASLSAQSGGCGTVVTPEVMQFESDFQKRLKEQNTPLAYTPVTLSLTAHLVHQNDGTGGLSEQELNNALEKLNQDYEPAGIRFSWCIKHINSTDLYYFTGSGSQDELTFIEQHNVSNSLNIYFVDVPDLCGYAYFPTASLAQNQRHLIIMNVLCSTNGSTLSHEVGHFFSLYHTHERAFGLEYVDGSNCINAGDLICDTPADPILSYLNVSPDCRYIGSSRDFKDMVYQPQVNNFMSYAVKECRNLFTPKQSERIRNGYDNYRSYLKMGSEYDIAQKTDTLIVCSGQSITLFAPLGNTYSWSTGETTQRLTVTPTKTTFYQVFSKQKNGCPISKNYLLIIKEVLITSDKTEICPGASAILTAKGGTDYEWSPATGLDQTTGSMVKATPNITTTYTLKAKVGLCTIKDIITIKVDIPPITLSQSEAKICEGSSVNITASGGSRYLWEPKTDITLSENGKYATLSPKTTTTYTVTGYRNDCSNTAKVKIELRDFKVNFTDTLVCYGEKVTLRVSGGENYYWIPDSELKNPRDSVITITAYSNIQYMVYSKSTNCNNPILVNIRIHQPLAITLDRSVPSSSETNDGIITIHVKNGLPPYQYSLNGLEFGNDSVFKGLSRGIHKIQIRDSRGCIVSTNTLLQAIGNFSCKNMDFEWALSIKGDYSDQLSPETFKKIIATDSYGNVYIAGCFGYNSNKFQVNFGGNVTLSSYNNERDIFIAKYDSLGKCIWAKRAGGEELDVPFSITVSQAGYIYLSGYYWGVARFGNIRLLTGLGSNFIAKYNSNGDCIWAKNTPNSITTIATDLDDNVYLYGSFSGKIQFGNIELQGVNQDIFIAKYDSTGSCVWAQKIGDKLIDYASSICTDSENNIYISGSVSGVYKFDNIEIDTKGEYKFFLAKLSSLGSYLWIKLMTPGNYWQGTNVALTTDIENNILMTGYFNGIAEIEGYKLICKGICEIFLTKFDSEGRFLWVKQENNSKKNQVNSIETDKEGNIYITGGFSGITKFSLSDSINSKNENKEDVFITKYDKTGKFIWAKQAGGVASTEWGYSVVRDNNDNLFIAGTCSYIIEFAGTNVQGGIFLTKLSCSGDIISPTCDLKILSGGDLIYPCNGTPVTLLAWVDTTHATFEWFPAEGLDNPKSLTPKASPKETTTYTLVAKKDTCTATTKITVTVPKRQAFGLDTNRVAYCAGGSAEVFLKNATGLTFEFQPAEGINFTAPDKITVTATQTNVFQIIGKRDGYCDYVVDLTVVVHPQPSVFYTPQASDGSNNGKITASAADGAAPYQFALDGNNFSGQSIFENLPAGQHILKVKDANGCQNQDTVWVEDCSQLSVNTGENLTICLGTSIEIKPTILPSNGFKSFLWLPTLGLSDPNALQVTSSPISTTTYTLTVSNDQGCIAVDSVTVTIKQLPIVNAGMDVSICPGESASLSATSDAVILRWSPETGLDNPTILNPKASPRRTTVYTLTADNGTCSTYDEVIVYVDELKLPSQEYICKNGSVVLDGGSGFDTYDWQPTLGLNNPKIQKPTASPTQTTTYTLTVKKGNCILTDSLTVNVMQAQAIENQTICTRNAVQLWAKGGTRYQWTPANGLSNPNSPYPVATPKVTTTYTVAVTDEFLCSDAVTVQVSVLSENSPLLTVDSVKEASCSGCIDGSISVRASGGLPPYQYSIDGGSFQPTGTFTGLGSGSYLVTVRDANGCLDDSLIRVPLLNIPCEIPTNLKASASNTSARVSWRAVPKAQAYQVFYREIGIPAWREEITTDNFIVLQPLTSGKGYETYVISLCENQVFSLPSDTISFIPKNCAMKVSYTVQDISCIGKRNGSIRIDSISGGLPPYALTFNGIPTDERVFPALTVGKYRIKTISSDGCTKEDTVTVGVEAGTNAPKIVMRNDTLFCQPAHFISYQWFRNGSSVSQNVRDAVHFTNRVAGSYMVRVQHSDTCIYRSEPFEYVYNSLQEVPETSLFEVYPNPFEDQTTIRFNANRPEQINIQVFDTRGALVYSRSEIDSGTTEVINLQLQTSGIYLLKIKAGSRIYTAKLVKF